MGLFPLDHLFTFCVCDILQHFFHCVSFSPFLLQKGLYVRRYPSKAWTLLFRSHITCIYAFKVIYHQLNILYSKETGFRLTQLLLWKFSSLLKSTSTFLLLPLPQTFHIKFYLLRSFFISETKHY